MLVRRDSSYDFCGGALYEFEALKQHTGVTIPQRDVIRARRSGLKTDGLTNHERDCLGFRFPDALRCACAAHGPVKSLVGYFVYQRRDGFSWGLAGKQLDFPAF